LQPAELQRFAGQRTFRSGRSNPTNRQNGASPCRPAFTGERPGGCA
jgi:hypothetical protein